jgi:hypothetical protein
LKGILVKTHMWRLVWLANKIEHSIKLKKRLLWLLLSQP